MRTELWSIAVTEAMLGAVGATGGGAAVVALVVVDAGDHLP